MTTQEAVARIDSALEGMAHLKWWMASFPTEALEGIVRDDLRRHDAGWRVVARELLSERSVGLPDAFVPEGSRSLRCNPAHAPLPDSLGDYLLALTPEQRGRLGAYLRESPSDTFNWFHPGEEPWRSTGGAP